MSLEPNAIDGGDEEFVDELKPGTKLMLGQYTIDDFLAAGGFGITYLAKDSLDRRVVIKECFPGSFCRRQNHSVTPRSRAHQNELKSIVRMFSQEAMSLAKAKHPNIVGVHQVFEENNTAYMALDYVHGRDLLEILQEEPESLKPELVESYLVKMLDAIKHIHDMGMLHRDISPDNIIIDEAGEPILIDFGAARESSNERVTRMLSALRVVKDGYSPQEFYIAGSDQTPSCDLYSLAASFYHLITGELPPDSQLRLSSCAAGDEDPYVSLGEKTQDYSKSFISALDKAMSILPRDRMQDADEWLQHMENGAPTKVATKTKTKAKETAQTNSDGEKKTLMPVLLGSTAIAAAAGAGFFLLSSPEAETVESTTETQQATSIAPQTASEPELTETASAVPVETPEPEVVTAGAADGVSDDVAGEPELAEVAEVTVEIAEPPLPAVEETTDFVVPPILAALPENLTSPQPRPFRGAEEATSELEDETPVIDTVAPATPEPELLTEITEPGAPIIEVVEAPAPETVQEEPAAPVEVVDTPAAEPSQGIGSNASLDFFMSMPATSQPDIVSARSPRAQAPASTEPSGQPQVETVDNVPQAATPETASADTTSTEAPLAPSPSIVTRSVSVMPFTLSPWQPGAVISVAERGPAWLEEGSRIISINGQPVTTNEEITLAFDAGAAEEGELSFDVTLAFDTGVNTAVSERTLTVSKEHHTMLVNGLQFVSRNTGESWITEVSEAPATSNFKVGDRLVSFVSTWEDLTGPDSLEAILSSGMESGASTFSFAVSRNGEIWIEAFNLTPLN
ncbi:MAG: protein kinase [Pseudomonadota bacterium]